MSWKLVGIQEGLLPYSTTKPELFVPVETGEWQTSPDVTPHVYGYQKEGWKGAPWAPVNFVWVKRPIWILEAVSKDPYYLRETGLLVRPRDLQSGDQDHL